MRYLFGPTSVGFADEYLHEPRRDGLCLAVGADLAVGPGDRWEQIVGRLPVGWRPARVVLRLDDLDIPEWVWSVPVPLIGLLPDGDLRPAYYRQVAPLCDAVLAEPPVSAGLAAACGGRVRLADLSGLGRSAFDPGGEEVPRDIDVLLLDPLDPAVRRERLNFAGRVAQLADRMRVVIRRPASPSEDRHWLARAKLVAIPASSGADRLTYQAIAAGAVPVRVPLPWDGPDGLRPGFDFIPYTPNELEAVLLDAAARDEDRRAVALSASGRVREWGYARRLAKALAGLDPEQPNMSRRAAERAKAGITPGLPSRVWAAVAGGRMPDWPTSDDPAIDAARGGLTPDPTASTAASRRAMERDPDHPVAAANLAEALAAADDPAAVPAAHAALRKLEAASAGRSGDAWDCPLYPPADAAAGAAWAAAVWAAGDPAAEGEGKRAVLRWRLHALLARRTGDLSHYLLAAMARPDEPTARAAAGCRLAAAGRAADGLPHLKAAVGLDPFDRLAACALMAALSDAGDARGRRLFARQQERLSGAAPFAAPSEPWFALDGPVGDEPLSVLLISPDLSDRGREAVDRVLLFTRPPAELVVVNTGSDLDTAAALRRLTEAAAPARVLVLETGPVGYAAAVARGLEACGGEFVAVLDGRTRVGPGWADGLADVACGGGPPVGFVSPTRGEPDRRPPATAPAAVVSVPDPGCVFFHRLPLNAVGPPDVGYTSASAAVADWGLRASRAGFVNRRAVGVRADAVSSDPSAADLERLARDWPANAPRLTPDGCIAVRPRVSLVMIVRNEEPRLAAALDSVRDLVDELIVADTGSTDGTKAVAAGRGASVFDVPWADDFAAARNAALARATGEYAFWMDADDRLDEPNREALRELLAGLGRDEPAAHVMACRCAPDRPGGPVTVVDHVRLFPVRSDVRWRYRVHEQILPDVRRAGLPVRRSAVVVDHVGYSDPSVRRAKLDRDLRLLNMELIERPGHPFALFNRGLVLHELGRDAEAIPCLTASLAASDPGDSIVRKLYARLAQCHRRLNNPTAAMGTVRDGLRHTPDDPELLFLDGTLRREAGDLPGAEAAFRRLLADVPTPHFDSLPAGLRGPIGRHELAVTFHQQGRSEEAAVEWRAAVTADPDFAPAWAGLGELAATAGDADALAEASAALRDHDPPLAAGLDALRLLARGETAAARAALAAAAARWPADPRVRDWAAKAGDGPEDELAPIRV